MSGSNAETPQGQTWRTLYSEDTVVLKDDPRVIGVVIKTWHEVNSEDERLDDDTVKLHASADLEVLAEYMRTQELRRGYAIVSPLTVDVAPLLIHESALTLLDRHLTFGLTVKRTPTDSMSGTVINTGGKVDLRHSLNVESLGDDDRQDMVRDVDVDDLEFGQDWQEGEYVIWRNCWLGVVEEVVEDVTIRLGNGSVVTVDDPAELNVAFSTPQAPSRQQSGSRPSTSSGSNPSSRRSNPPNGTTPPDGAVPGADNTQSIPADRLMVGQYVKTTKGNLRRGVWKYGAYDANVEPMGYVIAVTVNSLYVNWLCQNMMVRGRFVPIERPEPWQESEEMISELRRFKRITGNGQSPDADSFQISDRVRFKDLNDALVKYNTPERRESGVLRKVPRTESLGYDVNTFLVTATHTWVEVQWQDLTVTREEAINLFPYENVDEHDLWPGDFVIVKSKEKSAVSQLSPDVQDSIPDADALEFILAEKVGVVQKVNAADRIAAVKWYKDPKMELAGNMVIPGSCTGPLEEGDGVDVSFYDVSVHPALAIRRGDLVLVAPDHQRDNSADAAAAASDDAESSSGAAESAGVSLQSQPNGEGGQSQLQWMMDSLRGIVDTGLIANLSASLANTTSPQFQTLSRLLSQLPASMTGSSLPNSLSFVSGDTPADIDAAAPIDWFGEVVDISCEGLITVRLGALEEVQNVTVPVERLTVVFGDEMLDDDDDYSDMDSSDPSDSASSTSSEEETEWISEEVFYEGGERMDEGNEADWLTDEEDGEAFLDTEGDVSMSGITPATDPEIHTDEMAESKPDDSGAESKPIDGASAPVPSDSPAPTAFSLPASAEGVPAHFEVLESAAPTDHAFIRQSPTLISAQFLRRLHKEHKILANSLPEGIFVRTWESRMDLLRVLIIGPLHTPYELAPFVFDFHLGPDFPNSPPAAYFHSWTNGIGRINPNLYEDGKICLSLLGTWHAERKTENWTSSGSTLLQVLVSLMGLVLVREPYYNEAGFSIYVGSQESALNSTLYSEKAFLLSRGFVRRVLEQPVQGIDDVIRWMYLPSSKGINLLAEVVKRTQAVVDRSGQPNGSDGGESSAIPTGSEGLGRISAGALVPLKRTLKALEDRLSADVEGTPQ